jgi:hypothetical protein
MRERGKPTDEPGSPPHFSNKIRTAIYHAFSALSGSASDGKRDEQRTTIR